MKSCSNRFQLRDLRTRRQRFLIPNFPRGLAFIQFLEMLFILESVHALPESRALVGQQGLFFDEAPKRLAYEFFSRLNVLKDVFAKREESAIDPNIGMS